MEDTKNFIVIHSITDMEEGGADMEFSISDEYRTFIEGELNQESVTDDQVSSYVLAILTKAVEAEDGYNIEKVGKKHK